MSIYIDIYDIYNCINQAQAQALLLLHGHHGEGERKKKGGKEKKEIHHLKNRIIYT